MSENYNVDLLMQVREKIQTEPERHYQGLWAREIIDPARGECGTAYCVAGWAAFLSGEELHWIDFGKARQAEALLRRDEYGDPIYISNYARDALGLDRDEAIRLFAGGNKRDAVLKALDLLIEAGKNGERASEDDLWSCFR